MTPVAPSSDSTRLTKGLTVGGHAKVWRGSAVLGVLPAIGRRWRVPAMLSVLFGLSAATVSKLAPAASLVLVASALACLMTGLAGRVWIARARDSRSRDADAIVDVRALDPDCVLVTDDHGNVLAANDAAGDLTPEIALIGWCVDAGATVEDLVSEARHRQFSKREFYRQGSVLRVSIHVREGADLLFVWHFVFLRVDRGRSIDALGVSVLTRYRGDQTLNAAARALFGEAAEDQAALWAATAATREGDPEGPFQLALPDGKNVHVHRVTGRDGAEDLIFLPAGQSQAPRRSGSTSVQAGADTGVAGAGDPSGFEDIPVALLHIAPDGRISRTNRHARALLGLERGAEPHFWEIVEGLGRPVSDWLADARAGRALGRPEVLRATLPVQETFVQVILRPDNAASSEMSDTDGLVAVISDATELKSLEARFVQSQKMQAIGQLAGGVAHDFNNLLTAISGHCDLLLLNRDRFDPDYNDLLQIHQNANRAAALVRQLLAFSRKQTLKPEIVRLESLLEDLTHLLTRLVGERIDVVLTHDPMVGAIRADRRQLEQVILNLVVNARDAMPMGGEIRIETEARTIEQEQELGRVRLPPGGYALIRVVDQGLGIPPDIIDKIFEPFFTTKKLGEGTGLGLSTAYGIVKQMGGYIFAESIEGAGTTFTLYFASEATLTLPVPEPAREPPRMASPKRISRNAPLPNSAPVPRAKPAAGAILLVEDEAPVRAFAARALRLQGYQVFEAQDGEQALEFLRNDAVLVDLFVTDVVMPGIDGPGWVADALIKRPRTPVVFVSGYTEDTLSAAMSRIPRSVFLGKPFSLKDLNDTIAEQLAIGRKQGGVAAAP